MTSTIGMEIIDVSRQDDHYSRSVSDVSREIEEQMIHRER
jgi:hypothetical protein